MTQPAFRSRPARIAAIVVATIGAMLTAAAARPNAGVGASAPRPRATGRIEGSVEISTALSARRPQFRPYSDPGSGMIPPPPPRDPIAAELHNVVIYLEGDSTQLPAPAGRADAHRRGSMAQHDERFVPHVLAIMQGGVVDFPNEDDVYHNVFSLSTAAAPGGKGFDLGRYPNGSSKSWTFLKPGTVQVFCHIHGDMSAFVLVRPNPYFATPDDEHRFVIDEVPEGDYTIVGWHERYNKGVSHRVHVIAGQTTSVDFNIPLPPGGPASR